MKKKIDTETKTRFQKTGIWIIITAICYALMTGNLEMEVIPLFISVLIGRAVTKRIYKDD